MSTRKALSLVVLNFIFTVFGCHSQNVNGKAPENYFKGKIKKLTTVKYNVIPTTTGEYIKGDELEKEINLYNNNGDILITESFEKNKVKGTSIYEYDKISNNLKKTTISSENGQPFLILLDRNPRQNINEHITLDFQGKQISMLIEEFFPETNTSLAKYYSGLELFETTEIQFNKDHKIIYKKKIRNKILNKEEFNSYHGDLIIESKVKQYQYAPYPSVLLMKYTYNDDGYLINKTSFLDDNLYSNDDFIYRKFDKMNHYTELINIPLFKESHTSGDITISKLNIEYF